MATINHNRNIARIFASLDPKSSALSSRESGTIEFKQSFDWANKAKYSKTMAAFANNRGGYIIFGVTNSPRLLAGISGAGFENHDEATISAYLNGIFSPQIRYEKFSREIAQRKIGVIYVHQHETRPVISIKNDGDIREAKVYYRYNARTDKIKYPELIALIDLVRVREREAWMKLFERVSSVGPSNTGVMNLIDGTIEGAKGSLLIDAALIPKLKFIKEGSLNNSGRPALKLIGDVRPISHEGSNVSTGKRGGIRLTNDLSAPAVREETILEQFPLSYGRLVRMLKKRFSDFKQGNEFHKLKARLQENPAFCITRFLDPKNPRGSRQKFYSLTILPEFDLLYTKRNTI